MRVLYSLMRFLWLENLQDPFFPPHLDVFTCNCPQDPSFAGELVQSCQRPEEGYTDGCTRVHPLTPLQDSIIAQVLFPWKQG